MSAIDPAGAVPAPGVVVRLPRGILSRPMLALASSAVRRARPLVAAALLGFAPALAGGPGAPTTSALLAPSARTAPESVARLLGDLARWNRRGMQVDPERLDKCGILLLDLDRAWTPLHPEAEAIQVGLLDFLGRCNRVANDAAQLAGPPPAASFALITEPELRRRAREILRRRLPGSRRALTLGILMGREDGEPHPLDRRIAACEVLALDSAQEATLALLSTTRPAPPETRVPPELLNAAVASLAGRTVEGVHLRLIDLLAKSETRPTGLWKSGVERHFGSIALTPKEGRSVAAVAAHVRPALLAEDWRTASRGIGVGRCLPHSTVFPGLIESLRTWIERGEAGDTAVLRIQGELVAELERRSGRTYGAHPERWQTLLEAWRRGETPLVGEGQGPIRTTVGGFFGLRPTTDRVTFVLDCSGSMEARFGDETGHTRLEEAADQMAAFVGQLGPGARFNVVAFSDGAQRWRDRLAEVDEDSVRAATRFVLRAGPDGGTRLRAGVRLAMHVDAGGVIDLSELEADTVIVLCDGGTVEGPRWVEPFLRAVNDEARVVFHAVQLGTGGDGTLEALCNATGGDFLRVDG